MVEKQRKSNGKIEGGVTGKGWKPGQSGNPKGRPKKDIAIADILNKRGSEVINFDTGMTRREQMLENVYGLAMRTKPERWAVEFISDRTEGKAKEFRETTVKTEPIKVFEFED